MRNAPTRSADTERHYRNRVCQLTNKCERDTGLPPTFGQLVTWFESCVAASKWRHPTFRQYRAALVYEAERLAPEQPEAVAAGDRLRALVHRGFRRQRGERVRKEDQRTSSKKQRSFPPGDLSRIQRHLLKGKWTYAELAVSWLRVGLVTGMRPDEHFRSEVVRGSRAAPFKVALRIKNGKDSNGRAHGAHRHLGLDFLPQTKLALLEAHFVELKRTIVQVVFENRLSRVAAFKKLQRTVADRVARAGIELWPRRSQRPTMYSTRHQFIADCKAAGIPRKELAAMVGHATEETAGTHYARAGAGRNAVVVQPHPAEVLRIRPGRTGRFAALKGKAAKAKSGK